MMRREIFCFAVLVAALATSVHGSTIILHGTNGSSISFIGGFGTDAYSRPGGISGDGTTVVGESSPTQFSGTGTAWKWTSSGGFTAIPALINATGVSYNGSVIIGAGSGGVNQGVIVSPSGNTTLGNSQLSAVSPDGSIVLGSYINTDQGFRWTASGITNIPGILGSDSPSSGMSSDGSAIVGQVELANGHLVAGEWTAATGTVALTTGVGGATSGVAEDISDNKSVIVGTTANPGTDVPAFWSAANGWQPMTSGGAFGVADDLTPNGEYAVGNIGFGSGQAFLWDANDGLRILQTQLTARGINLTGYTLTDAYGITDDGGTIVGQALAPGGSTTTYVAVLPEPSGICMLGFGMIAPLGRRRAGRR